MTTFTDREHAIEAHYAAVELSAFRDHLHRCKELGLTLAARANLQGDAAREFALKLAERCAGEASRENVYRYGAEALAERGVKLSEDEIRGLIPAGGAVLAANIAPPPGESWVAFVTHELMALFSTDHPIPPYRADESLAV